jgi:hypothetical protein
MNEGKKDRRDPIRTVKPRNFVAKNASATTSGAGAHKDKKKAMKQGETKHKNKEYAEGLQTKLNVALAEAGSPAQQAAIAINMKKHHQKPKSEEVDQDEYSDEAGMSYGSLHTIARAATGLLDTIQDGDNLPEWCQEKISLAEDYLVTVWDYLQSEKEQGVAEGGYNDYDNNRTGFRRPRREDDEYHVPDPDPELQRNRQETMMYNVTVGGKPMTEKPFLGRSAALAWARQQVNAGTLDAKEAKLSPVRYNESRINEKSVSKAQFRTMAAAAHNPEFAKKVGIKPSVGKEFHKADRKQDYKKLPAKVESLKDPKDNPCWTGYKPVGTKKKGGKTVPNCVPKEGWTHDTLADQLFEHERTYEDRLQNLLNKKLGK